MIQVYEFIYLSIYVLTFFFSLSLSLSSISPFVFVNQTNSVRLSTRLSFLILYISVPPRSQITVILSET